MIQTTDWQDGTGEGIFLNDDGTVHRRMPFVNDLAEGEGLEYDESGNVVKHLTYRGGELVDERPATRSAE